MNPLDFYPKYPPGGLPSESVGDLIPISADRLANYENNSFLLKSLRKKWRVGVIPVGDRMDLFPIFLKLTGRRCLVVGAGNLAESKIESLRTAHADVTVIAPWASPRILDLAAAGELTLHQREYAPGDVHTGLFLVVTATNVPAVNRAVYLEAVAANILCNAVDDPPFCDFYFPSVVRRGDLQIAISTAGASPALAQRLRKEINAQLPLDTGDWLTDLGNLRREVTQMEPLNEERKWLLHQLAQREVCGFDQCPSRVLAREHAKTNPMPNPPSVPEIVNSEK